MLDLFGNCIRRYACLSICRPAMEAVYDILRISFEQGGKLLICGNGGSASDSGHMAAELLKSFLLPRPIPTRECARLGEDLSSKLQGALPAISLPDFVAINTAYANDCDPHYHFAQLTWAFGNPQDILFGISTSGNAKNVCLAAQVARAKGMKVVGLSGKTGGTLKPLCDACICVPEEETYKIQELHLPIYHTLCAMLEQYFFSQKESPHP